MEYGKDGKATERNRELEEGKKAETAGKGVRIVGVDEGDLGRKKV